MMSIRLKLFLNIFLLLFLQFNFLKKINAQKSCTPLIKQTRYSIQSDEDFFSVLKNFRLEPVIGDGGSLEILQKLNSMSGQTTAQAGTEVIIPFKCEEQLIGWRVIDRGSYRLIASEHIDKNNTGTSKIKTESLTTDEKTLDILNKDIPGEVVTEMLGGQFTAAGAFTVSSDATVGVAGASAGDVPANAGKLQVNGQGFSRALYDTTDTTLTWNANNGNVLRWSPATTASQVNISNMQPGAAYMLVIKGGGVGTVLFNCNGAGNAATGYVPTNGNRIAGTLNKSIYTLIYDSENCLITWITGY